VIPRPTQTPKRLNQVKAELPKLHGKFIEALEMLVQTDSLKEKAGKNENRAEKQAKKVLTELTTILNKIQGSEPGKLKKKV